MSLFELKCPTCKGTLWVDSSTLKIVDHKAAADQQKKADFEQFLKSSKQDRGWDEKMKKAREEEAARKLEIEQKFKEAKENKDFGKDDNDTGMRSPFDWD